MDNVSTTNWPDATLTWLGVFGGARSARPLWGQEPFVLGGRGVPKDSPLLQPPFPSWEDSEVKPGGLTAEWGWLWDLLLQHKEMDTKILERPTMTLRTEWGKLPCF